MDKKATDILSYITFIGWLIAFVLGNKEESKFHLNQGLALAIVGLANIVIGWIPILGWLVSKIITLCLVACIVCGIIFAAQGEEKELPLIGAIKILK